MTPPSEPTTAGEDESKGVDCTEMEGVTVVICGDQYQLGPRIESDEARKGELDVSLLGRLFERSCYFDHPMARARGRGMAKLNAGGGDGDENVDFPSLSTSMAASGSGKKRGRRKGGSGSGSGSGDGVNGAEMEEEEKRLLTPFCNLKRNYRSLEGLLMLPSALVGFSSFP